MFGELNDAAFKENELEELDNELQLLSNAEEIKTALSKTYYSLREGEEPVVSVLKQLASNLQHYQSVQPQLPLLVQRLQSAQIELQDIADEVESINDNVNFDAKRIEWINERIALGYKLLKKHGLQNTNELLQLQSELEQKLQAVLNIDETLAAKEKEVSALFKEAMQNAKKLNEARQKQTEPLSKEDQ